jgi:hypothetical protein
MKITKYLISFMALMINNQTQAGAMNKFSIEELLESDSISNLVSAAYLAKTHAINISDQRLYRKAVKLDSNNILLLEQLILLCNDDSPICHDKEKYIERLIKLDSENAIPNLYAVVYFSEQKKYKKALRYLKQGAKKTVFDDYNFQRVSLVKNALLNNNESRNDAFQLAINALYLGYMHEPLAKIMAICSSQSQNSTQWKKTCIKFGKLMEASSTMVLSTFVGYGIQRDILAFDKADSIAYENIKNRRDVFHQFRLRVGREIKFSSFTDKTDYTKIPDLFFHELEKFDEKVAYQHVLDRQKENKK